MPRLSCLSFSSSCASRALSPSLIAWAFGSPLRASSPRISTSRLLDSLAVLHSYSRCIQIAPPPTTRKPAAILIQPFECQGFLRGSGLTADIKAFSASADIVSPPPSDSRTRPIVSSIFSSSWRSSGELASARSTSILCAASTSPSA